MRDVIDGLIQADHAMLPVERAELESHDGCRVDFRGIGRLCHAKREVIFSSLMTSDSCYWNASRSEHEIEMKVSLDFLTPSCFRLQLARSAESLYRKTEMIDADIHEQFSLGLQEEEDHFAVDTGRIRVIIDKNPYRIFVRDLKGGAVAELGGRERTSHHQFDALPTSLVMREDGVRACENFRLAHDEEIFGMGERFQGMRRRGQTVRNWIEDGKGNHTPLTYKPIPFLLSTRGYGIFFNTSYPFTAAIGSRSAYEATFVIEEDRLDYYFFYGDDLPEIISHYTALTGRAPMPPEWSFGVWLSGDSWAVADDGRVAVDRMRDEKIPCDVINYDMAWQDANNPPGSPVFQFNCSFEPSEKWGNLAEIVEEMHEKGLRVCLWTMPYITEGSSAFEDGLAHNAFVETWVPSDPPMRVGVIDFSRPEGVAWYQSKIEKLLRAGVDTIKVDFGETSPVNVGYHRYTGAEMHNLYPLLYQKAIWEVVRKIKGEGDAVIWARPGYTGCQRYPVHWSGDPDASFETLGCVVRAGLSLSMAGFSFWANDLGGYFSTPSPELYIRWTQFAFFCSHVRAHGGTPREPWVFGDEALANFRKYANLRYTLMPYIIEEAEYACRNGLPFIRPLVLSYGDDRTTWYIEDQYLFGRSILVAPLLAEGGRSRKVYLPQGTWKDFWSEETFAGPGWIDCDAPLDHLPLFVADDVRIQRQNPCRGEQFHPHRIRRR